MEKRGHTSRVRRGVLCVEGCYMLRYAMHGGFELLFFSPGEEDLNDT